MRGGYGVDANAGYNRSDRLSASADASAGKKKKKCGCSPILAALLGCLALAALVLGILFALGVLGGKGGD